MSNPVELYLPQKRWLSDILEAFTSYNHVLGQAQTGFGKSICFSEIARRALLKGNSVLILSDRCELLNQAGGSLKMFGLDSEYISQKHRKIPSGNLCVAMSQTLRRRILSPSIIAFIKSRSLVIIDECHAGEFDWIFESGLLANVRVLGVTATPERTGKMRQLGLDYECIVLGEKTKNLIRDNFLVPARYFVLDAPDLSVIDTSNTNAGFDFNSQQVRKVYSSPDRYLGLINNIRKICPDKCGIVFCANQAHAIETCIELNNAGFSAKFVVSGFGKDDDGYELLEANKHLTGKRDDIVQEFADRKFQFLVNAKIFSKGFDAKWIEVVIKYSATLSKTLYLQELGRGSRAFKGKSEFLYLDFGGNYARFGGYEDDRHWSLWHNEAGSNGIVPMKVCPADQKDKEGKFGCGKLIPNMAQECPFCGYIFKTEKELREIELTEIIGGKFAYRDMTPSQLLAHAELTGKSKLWAFGLIWMGSKTSAEFRKAMKELGYSSKYSMRLCDGYDKKNRKNYEQIDKENELKRLANATL